MSTLTESADIILRAATQWEKLAQVPGQPTGDPGPPTAHPADIQNALQSAGLFGGVGAPGKRYYTAEELAFDPGSKTAKLIFALMDGLNPPYEGKMGATLTISPSGDVTINVGGDRANELGPRMQGTFGRPMSKTLKLKKVLPAGVMQVKWLESVG